MEEGVSTETQGVCLPDFQIPQVLAIFCPR